jgi:hypothetical protein
VHPEIDTTGVEDYPMVSEGRVLYAWDRLRRPGGDDDETIRATKLPGEPGTMSGDGDAPTPALFLTGQGNIMRDFAVAFDTVADAQPGSLALKLTPKRKQPEYDSLTLVVDAKTLALQMLITLDAQGGRSAFTFSNLKENVGLADNHFVFKMPRNVDVITDGGR